MLRATRCNKLRVHQQQVACFCARAARASRSLRQFWARTLPVLQSAIKIARFFGNRWRGVRAVISRSNRRIGCARIFARGDSDDV